jgi:heme-degrading monooxygenase HmoA
MTPSNLSSGPVVLEVAVLNVRPGSQREFESAFAQAEPIISGSSGYISHQLQRCLETPNRYLLLVNWRTLEDHTQGFRESSAYQRWRELLHHFYDPFPTVEHYVPLEEVSVAR